MQRQEVNLRNELIYNPTLAITTMKKIISATNVIEYI